MRRPPNDVSPRLRSGCRNDLRWLRPSTRKRVFDPASSRPKASKLAVGPTHRRLASRRPKGRVSAALPESSARRPPSRSGAAQHRTSSRTAARWSKPTRRAVNVTFTTDFRRRHPRPEGTVTRPYDSSPLSRAVPIRDRPRHLIACLPSELGCFLSSRRRTDSTLRHPPRTMSCASVATIR